MGHFIEQFERDYEEETGNKVQPEFGMFSIVPYCKYLEDRLKDEIEKVRQLSEMVLKK